MNIKKTLLILIIATTMCACSDTTEPNPPEPVLLDTTYIGDTMKVTYKDWVKLDWSPFDNAWDVLQNSEFTIFKTWYYEQSDDNYDEDYYDTLAVIKNDSAKIKKIFNELWEKHKRRLYLYPYISAGQT